jgi:NADH-quinone oxidoreductase subunit H
LIQELTRLFIFPGFFFALFLGLLYLGIDRKLVARLQNRIGPPIWQNFIDFVKLMSKETIRPGLASGFFLASPMVSFASLLTLTLALPLLGSVVFTNFDNVILIIYLLLLSSVFIAFAGFSSGNPFSVIGSMRKITQVIAVEFPFLVALFTATIVASSLSLTQIMSFQTQNSYLALTIPLSAIAFLISVQGALHRTPFDIPDAKQEIVAGMYTEYSGAGLALFELIHALKFFILISLTVILFFGGASTLWIFLLKFLSIGLLLTLLRAIFSRLRLEQMFKFYWLLIGPIALIDLLRVMFL